MTYGLHPYDVHGEQIPEEEFWFTGIRKSKFGRTLDRHLHQGIYDKEFLISVFIRQDELEKWCWRINERLPAFWFPGQVNQWGPVVEDDVPQETESSKAPAGQQQDEAKQEPPQKEEPNSIRAVARKAAQKRYEPVTKLKQEFFDSWSRGKHKSRADEPGGSTHLFLMTKGAYTVAWQKALKRAGIENFRWHDLRHTWASWLAQKGAPLTDIQEMGGWETYAMVKRYAHLLPAHMAHHARVIDGLINTDLAQSPNL